MRRGVIVLAGVSTETRLAVAGLADLDEVPLRVFTDLGYLASLLVGGGVGRLQALVVDFCRHPVEAGDVVRAARRSRFYRLTPVVGIACREGDVARVYSSGVQSVVLLGAEDDEARLTRMVSYWMLTNQAPPAALLPTG